MGLQRAHTYRMKAFFRAALPMFVMTGIVAILVLAYLL
jgi:hypothetical protein